jgi:hypothetical protein
MADDTAPRNPGDRPSERTWVIPTTTTDAGGAEVPNLDQAQYALNEAAVILMRIGGTMSIVAKRVELPPEGPYGARHETEFLGIRWQQFSPSTPKVTVSGAGEDESAE